MRMTTSELIHAAYHAARYLPKASSQLVRELAERLDTTQAALCESLKIRNALASENGQMLRLLTDISENHLEYLSEDEDCMMAGVPLDYVSEINAYVARDIEAENPFQATDAFLAEVRASELDSLAGVAETMLVKFANQNASQIPEAKGWEMIQRQASHRAAQLRGNSNGGAL
ncbi:hypothetical protein [Atlantibacter hermannii]|uniref:hypothetical protein n=1 Tax=Atlantibacter hermannii TaxID=565 RepID=UPI0006968D1B|nr:hypothetical protein [Atlantibacter hermannii]